MTTFGTDGVALSDVGGSGDSSTAFAMTILSGGDNNGFVLEEFTSAGALDTSFGTGGIVSDLSIDPFTAYTITMLSGGNILLSGGDGTDAVMTEFNSGGSLDTSFGSGGAVVTSGPSCWQSITVLSGGDILAVGISGDNDGEIVLGEFTSDGGANTSFGSSGLTTFDAYATYLAITLNVSDDGEIEIGALATPYYSDVVLAEFTSAGELDTSYGDGGSYVMELAAGFDPWAIALDGSGGILVVGSKSGKLSIADIDL